MAEQLTQKDWFLLFDMVAINPDCTINDAKKVVDKYRTTVARALGIALRLSENGIKPLDEEKAELIAKNTGYGSTSKSVYEGYYHYLNWHDKYGAKELLKKLHLERIFQQVDNIRVCLEHHH